MSRSEHITGTCHCGAVSFTVSGRPTQITDCNCSLCRRYRGLWAHVSTDHVTTSGDTRPYSHGSRNIAFHACATCHCVMYWSPLKPQPGSSWMAVNLAMADPGEIADIPIRRFDGAESWSYIE